MVDIPNEAEVETEEKLPTEVVEETPQGELPPIPMRISSIPVDPLERIKLATQFDIRPDKIRDEPLAVEEVIKDSNRAKTSALTSQTLKNLGIDDVGEAGDFALKNPDAWNEFTSAIGSLEITDNLQDEKADLLFGNMWNEEKENDVNRQMRILELNQQLQGMRDSRTKVGNFMLDASKVFYDLSQSAQFGLKSGATLGTLGLATAPFTGPAALPLAATGAVVGFARGFMSHLVYDGYIKASSSMYEQLGEVVNEKGEYLEQEDRRNIALGVGVVNTALNFVGNMPIVKNSPLGKFFNGNGVGAKLVSQAQYKPQMIALKKIGADLALNGGTEAATVLVEKVGQAIGQAQADENFDAEKFWDGIANLGTLEEMGYAGAVGIAGTSPLSAVSYRGIVRREADAMIVDRAGEFNRMRMEGIPENQIPAEYQPNMDDLGEVESVIEGKPYDKDLADLKAVEAKFAESALAAKRDLDYYDRINNVIEVFKKPEMKDKSFREKTGAAILEAAGIDHLFIDPIKMGQIILKLDNDSVRERIEQQLSINPDNFTAAPIKVSAIDFINMAHEAPQIKEAFLRTASSEVAETANLFIKKVGDTVQKFKDAKDVKALDIVKDIVFTEHKNGSSLPYGTKNYHDFLKLEEVVPEEVWANLTENERKELNAIVNPAKIEVMRDQKMDRKELDDKLLDVVRLRLIGEQKKSNQKELYKDKDRQYIDAFMASKRKKEPLLWRINPNSLGPRLKKKFAENARLKELNVFDSKNGKSIDDITAELGYKNNTQTLETLSTAYSTAELEFMASQSDKLFIDGEVVDVKKRFSDSAAIEKQLSDGQAVFRQIAEKMLDIINKKTEGSVEKKVIFKLPKNETIDYWSQQTVENNSIYDLGDETKYSNMVKKHQMAAWKFMRAGDYKKAVEAWTSALYANRMAGEVRIARRQAFKLADAIKDLDSEQSKKMFQQAGGPTEQAGKELYELFTVPNAEVRKIEAYRQAQKAKGNYVPPIKAKRNKRQLVDITQMTGGEVRDLLQLTQGLMRQADRKSTIVMKRKGKAEQLMLDQDRTLIRNNIAQSGRAVKLSVIGKGYGKLKTLKDAYITGQSKAAMVIAEVLDQYKEGPVGRLMLNIKAQYDMAEVAKQNLNTHVQSIIGDFNKKMGENAFANMRDKEVYVEEFANNRLLRNGKMNEMELMMMVGHLGSESNRKRLENFGPSADDFQKIVEKYLTVDHIDTMQKFWDIYETFKEPIVEVNKQVWGFSDTKFIPARDFEMFGKIYKGGYLPAIAERKGTTYLLERDLGNFNKEGQIDEINYKYTGIEDFTNTDRLKTRTNTPHILSLEPEHLIYSYSALIHDIHMRPILDYGGKLLNDGKTLEAINGFFGNETDSAELVNYLKAMGDNTHVGEKTTTVFLKTGQFLSSTMVVGSLALRPLTIIAQHFSQIMVPTQLKNKLAYFPEVAKEYKTIMSNPSDFKARVEFFAKHDPQLLKSFDEIHDLNQQVVTMFGKRTFENKKLNWLANTRNAMMQKAMASLKYSDIMAQVTARSTLYRMGMEGKLEAEGIQAGDEAAILAFARKVTEKTITGQDLTNLTEFQRDPAKKLFLFTYMSGLNLSFNLLRTNWNKYTDDYNNFRKEQETSVIGAAAKAATSSDALQNIGLVVLSTSIFPAIVRGLYKELMDDDKNKKDSVAKEAVINLFSPFSFVNGAAFALGNQWTKNVVPIQGQAEMFVETAQWAFNNILGIKDPQEKKKFKSAMLTTGAVMGLPSTQIWNGMLSPEARKNWNKAGRMMVGTVLEQFQSVSDADYEAMTPEEQEMFDYYKSALEQLEKGNMKPLQDLNDAIKNDPSIQSGEQESPIPMNDYEQPEKVRTENTNKPLSEDEKVGVKDWFNKLLNKAPKTKDAEDTTPVQQEAPEEDGASLIDENLIPSAGSTVVDDKELEKIAKIYAKEGLDTTSTSKNAFIEYEDLRDEYLAVLNDSSISDDNKLMRLSALVIAKGEDFKSIAYDDKRPNVVLSKDDKIKGVLTIGYGFTKDVKIGDTMTEDQGVERLMTELESRVKTLNKAEEKHELDLNINQKVALISAIYNGAWSPDKYKNSTAAIKKGFFAPLLANTLESSSQTHIDGLLKRRLLEYLIFNVAPPVVKNDGKNNLTAKLITQDTMVR